jgi:hypothetical protein
MSINDFILQDQVRIVGDYTIIGTPPTHPEADRDFDTIEYLKGKPSLIEDVINEHTSIDFLEKINSTLEQKLDALYSKYNSDE